MPRVRLSLVLIAALSLAACGSEPAEPTEAPATEAAPVAAPPAMMPDDAPPQEEAPGEVAAAAASGTSADCRAEIGEAASARLVARCIAVSPATRPPCNALNPCEMIQGEIDRSCAQYGDGEAKPTECAA